MNYVNKLLEGQQDQSALLFAADIQFILRNVNEYGSTIWQRLLERIIFFKITQLRAHNLSIYSIQGEQITINIESICTEILRNAFTKVSPPRKRSFIDISDTEEQYTTESISPRTSTIETDFQSTSYIIPNYVDEHKKRDAFTQWLIDMQKGPIPDREKFKKPRKSSFIPITENTAAQESFQEVCQQLKSENEQIFAYLRFKY